MPRTSPSAWTVGVTTRSVGVVTDTVNAADVLRAARPDWHMATDEHEQVDALLAHGGGDPVVVMPDGTLKRGHWVWVGTDWLLRPSDPVVPE